jgi:hypothetical protein
MLSAHRSKKDASMYVTFSGNCILKEEVKGERIKGM